MAEVAFYLSVGIPLLETESDLWSFFHDRLPADLDTYQIFCPPRKVKSEVAVGFPNTY